MQQYFIRHFRAPIILLLGSVVVACGSGADSGGVVAPPSTPSLSVLNTRVSESDTGATANLVFSIRLDHAVTDDVSFDYATHNGTASDASDYLSTNGTGTILGGSTQTTVTVSVTGDNTVEQNELLVLSISNPSTGIDIARASAFGTIDNDDGGMPVALAQTGQQICADESGSIINCTGTGQDGEVLAGVVLPSPRFTDNGDGSYTDQLTDLIWPIQGNIMPSRDPGYDTEGTTDDGIVTWQTALNYVNKLNAESYLGYNDWRLPNRNELRSLVNYNNVSLESSGFMNYCAAYWSSSTFSTANPTVAANAWFVNVRSGFVSLNAKTDTTYAFLCVVPVRGGSNTAAAVIPQTGQTQCFDSAGLTIACSGTGQDGEFQLGAHWPATRFGTNADTTITDNLTGLAWAPNANVMPTRDPGWDVDFSDNDGAVTWQHALDYIAKLNTENYLGHNDWRLPNVNEVLSLINYQTIPADYLTTAGFSNVSGLYWTSDTWLLPTSVSSDSAWAAHIGTSALSTVYGGSLPAMKKSSSDLYVWPVRG